MVDRKIAIVVLVVLLFLGLYLRSYHIDYPVIGYHNTKEGHTLGEGLQLYLGGDPLVNYEMYSIRESNPNGVHMDDLPLLSWLNAGLWSVFGLQLWIARLVIILFSLGAILMTYLVVNQFFKKRGVALVAAFFVTIMPLLVFFGRQVQYDMPAMFFILLGLFYFLKWKESPTHKNFLISIFSLTFAGLLKIPFMIIAVPIIAIFPFSIFRFNETFKKTYLKQILISVIFILAIVGFFTYSSYLDTKYGNPNSIEAFDPSKFGTVFTTDFWNAIYNFAVLENFTFVWLIFAFAGLGIAVRNILKRRSVDFEKFIVVYGLSYFAYILFSPPQMI